jgi:hypothetical protein
VYHRHALCNKHRVTGAAANTAAPVPSLPDRQMQ